MLDSTYHSCPRNCHLIYTTCALRRQARGRWILQQLLFKFQRDAVPTYYEPEITIYLSFTRGPGKRSLLVISKISDERNCVHTHPKTVELGTAGKGTMIDDKA